MIQAIFFDIDGTLVPHGKDDMPESTKKALHALKKKGIKLFIATGRPVNSIDHVKKMFDFDGYLTANGQYCFNKETIIFEKYISHESIKQLIPYTEEKHIPVLYASLEHSYRNKYNNSKYDSKCHIVDYNTLFDNDIVQIMAYIQPEEDDEFLKHLPGCKSARWTDIFADIIPNDGGKDKGIDKIISYYNIPLENVMAFGDSGNDEPLLLNAGIGVTMKNGTKRALKKARLVSDYTNHEDGVIKMIEKLIGESK